MADRTIFHRNAISRSSMRKLEDWILIKWSQFEKDRPELRQIASLATKELGFQIVKGNIVGALRAVERTLPSPRRNGNGGGSMSAGMRSRFRVITAAMQNIYRELGIKLDGDMERLIDELKSEAVISKENP